MYNAESFNEYIRQVLGYPNLTKEKGMANNYTTNNATIYRNSNSFNNTGDSNINNCIENKNNQNNCTINNTNCEQNKINKILEESYPEIYKIIYPMINKKCNNLSKSVTSETINEITKEIFLAIEPSTVELSKSKTSKEFTINNTTKTSSGSGNLADLIKILVIREIISNQKITTISQNVYDMPYSIQKNNANYNDIYEF